MSRPRPAPEAVRPHAATEPSSSAADGPQAADAAAGIAVAPAADVSPSTEADAAPMPAASPARARFTGLMARLRDWHEPSLASLHAVRSMLTRPHLSRTATFALAAALGGAAGSLATTGLVHLASARDDALVAEALQGTIAVLATEVRTLRAAVAPEPPASLSAMAPAVSPEVTGSIAPAPPLLGWSVARVEGGRALLRGNGAFYEVTAGSILPGLGMVRAIGRDGGRWIVTTDGGIVASPGG